LRDICRITHHNDEAYVGALAVVRAIRLVGLVARVRDEKEFEAIARQFGALVSAG